MAYMDELEVGDRVTVTDLRRGEKFHGTIRGLDPDETGGQHSTVVVQYDDGTMVRVSPGFITLDKGEDS